MTDLAQEMVVAAVCFVICAVLGSWQWFRMNRRLKGSSQVLYVVRLISGSYRGLSYTWERGTGVVEGNTIFGSDSLEIEIEQVIDAGRDASRALQDSRKLSLLSVQLRGGAIAEVAIPTESVDWVLMSLRGIA